MESVIEIVSETVLAFESEYNLGKEASRDVLLYCRPTVERYFFAKLHDKLFAMYAIRNQLIDEEFQSKSALIKKLPPAKALEYLGVRKQFIFEGSELVPD